ncbi:hypothetical protein ACNJQJ_21840, partial [Mycobacterium tuberculosis]
AVARCSHDDRVLVDRGVVHRGTQSTGDQLYGAEVAECRSRSTSSLMELSFSIPNAGQGGRGNIP